jgi:hypothetical protein
MVLRILTAKTPGAGGPGIGRTIHSSTIFERDSSLTASYFRIPAPLHSEYFSIPSVFPHLNDSPVFHLLA